MGSASALQFPVSFAFHPAGQLTNESVACPKLEGSFFVVSGDMLGGWKSTSFDVCKCELRNPCHSIKPAKSSTQLLSTGFIGRHLHITLTCRYRTPPLHRVPFTAATCHTKDKASQRSSSFQSAWAVPQHSNSPSHLLFILRPYRKQKRAVQPSSRHITMDF